ncbi:MAG: potassium channel family protein [Candidatus Aureabacteria bacterium]|nr:potassium channel family protein [Candidatus Auribacterota bacterium]
MTLKYHRHLYVTLMLAIIMILIMVPFLRNDERGRFFLSLLLLLVILGALKILASSRRIFWVGVILGLGAGLCGPLLPLMTNLSPAAWSAVKYSLMGAYVAFFTLVIYVLLKSIFTGCRVTGDKIYAAISGYLLLGIFWALIYAIAEDLDPTSFGRVMPQWGGSFSELLYFSFTTLTTLGYGDIGPQTALSQTLSYMEAISGQLFVAILIARLVGMNIAQMTHTPPPAQEE